MRPCWVGKDSFTIFGTPIPPSVTLRFGDRSKHHSRPPDWGQRVGSGSQLVGESSGLEPSAAQPGTGHLMELAQRSRPTQRHGCPHFDAEAGATRVDPVSYTHLR